MDDRLVSMDLQCSEKCGFGLLAHLRRWEINLQLIYGITNRSEQVIERHPTHEEPGEHISSPKRAVPV